MMGYYKSPEALVRFRRAGEKEGRGQQREDKEGICPALGWARGPPQRDHLHRLELPSGQRDPLRPALPAPGAAHSGAGGRRVLGRGRRGPLGTLREGGGWPGNSSRFARAGDSKVKGDVPSAHSYIPGCLDETARWEWGVQRTSTRFFFPFHLHTK